MDDFINILTNMVQYNIEEEVKKEGEEISFASTSLNPAIRWTKFILTDDEPNGNKQRIPQEEFANILKTGIFMPIKVALGKIEAGHEDALPIGVITHLKKVKNKVVGLAALWSDERPEDVNMLKERYDRGEPLDLSWEIGYSDSRLDDETGIQDLLNTHLKAVTLVGIPAYGGRTSITAFASEDKTEDLTLDELTKVKAELDVAMERITVLEAMESKVEELKVQLEASAAEASNKDQELEELRAFKSTIEQAKAELEKRESIKERFTKAGLEKSDEYFNENYEKFSRLDEDSLDFIIQEFVAFSTFAEETVEEIIEDINDTSSASTLPVLTGEDDSNSTSLNDLVAYLRSRKQ